ncbi:MAG TPA: FAD-binding oxidoreductase [Pseudonocardiaceae bacterium]|jgi:FAD/FMN-containing dehydrogenase|nr:FAD-binding oxidoreductase [Pseudonocardiaceae bacterium]
MGELPGLDGHHAAVAALSAQYRALPSASPVRLAKPTSNLFRFRDPTGAPGLDVSDFAEVLQVDAAAKIAEVGGMTTYEDLVAATLPHGLMPMVVPQLKTITLGGAVAGLGIESSSFRNGLPHESVLEAEILTGDGRVITARPDNEHAALFRGFPNSYGTLGYTLRLRIELEPVTPYVRLRHLRFPDATACAAELARVLDTRSHDGQRVDFIDGTVFAADEVYLTLGDFVAEAPFTSDYTGTGIFYRSIPEREVDYLSIHDYLWRWDTDWFWCSRALGAQHPLVRRLWPKRYLRSDVYRRAVALDRRYRASDRLLALRGLPPQEPVIQDVEVPIERLAEFLDFFHREVGISPVWLCPLALRGDSGWPLYPLEPGTQYVNVGFWSAVDLRPGQAPGHHNRLIEEKVTELGGHKSLYSDSFYAPEEFWRLYNGDAYRPLKKEYDPDSRLPDLYAKCVRNH